MKTLPLKNSRIRSLTGRSIILPLIVVGLLLGVLGASRASAQSGITNGEEFIFGSVGLTATQTARLNVVNTADGVSITRVLKFLDAAGNIIVTKTVTLAPGEAGFLDLNGASLGAGRVQIRAVDPTCPGCNGQPVFATLQTLEFIDNITGRTDVFYAPAQFKPEGPPGSPLPFGMIGVGPGQTLRINVSSAPGALNPTDPIRVLLSFARSNGQLITNADGHPLQPTLNLLPGQTASFDLSADQILNGVSRAEIRPVIQPDGPPGKPSGPPNKIIATAEIINDATAKTVILYAPFVRPCSPN